MLDRSPSQIEFFADIDSLGEFARISVDPLIYGESAILKTAYWFTDHYYLFLAKSRETGLWNLEFRLKEGATAKKLEHACGEFINQLLDQAVRQEVLAETSSIRDTLLKKAFFEASAPTPVSLKSDEEALPSAKQGYLDDPLGIAGR